MKKEFFENSALWFNCSSNLSQKDCETLAQQSHLTHIQEAINIVSTNNTRRIFKDFFGEIATSLTPKQIKLLDRLEIKLRGTVIDVELSLPDDPHAKVLTKKAVVLQMGGLQ